ncbi:MAG: YifB family Mg chelatase-like AAA ATPase [Micrococcaceae bacterium]
MSNKEIGSAYSIELLGTSGQIIEAQSSIVPGLPQIYLIGLPDAALREAKELVKAALNYLGISLPKRKVIVNLLPASMPKQGTGFDVAIAISILTVCKVIPKESARNIVFIAELGIDGSIKKVPGTIARVLAAKSQGFSKVVVGTEDKNTNIQIPGIKQYSVRDLRELLTALMSNFYGIKTKTKEICQKDYPLDFADIEGMHYAKKIMQIAAAGRHHVLLSGVPGIGKTMLAQRLPSILPELNEEELLEVLAIHSLGAISDKANSSIPFEEPHHSSSLSAIIGGGFQRTVLPGSISKAHCGVLLLDETPEFKRDVLEALREPLESGYINISRSQFSVRFPAKFQLVLTMNKCPCGKRSARNMTCKCTPYAINRYEQKISGALLDRIDINYEVKEEVPYVNETNLDSKSLLVGVIKARFRQAERLAPYGLAYNSEISASLLNNELRIPTLIKKEALLKCDAGLLSKRGLIKVQKLALTIADLSNSDINERHINKALQLRSSDD